MDGVENAQVWAQTLPFSFPGSVRHPALPTATPRTERHRGQLWATVSWTCKALASVHTAAFSWPLFQSGFVFESQHNIRDGRTECRNKTTRQPSHLWG